MLLGLDDRKVLSVTSIIKLIEIKHSILIEFIIPTQEILIQLLGGIEPMRDQSL